MARVLARGRVRALRTTLCAGLCGLLLACSSEDRSQPSLGKLALDMARERIKKRGVETAQTPATPQTPGVTRAQMEALGRPVVHVTVPRFGSALPAAEIARNGPYKTYMGADQATVTLRRGIITATRGQLVDLIGQELSIAPEALFSSAEPLTYTRTQRHLTGEGTLSTFEYACAIAPHPADETLEIFGTRHSVRQFTELCRNKTRAFQNSYWVERASGTVWQSHQSISKQVGHMVLQRVVK